MRKRNYIKSVMGVLALGSMTISNQISSASIQISEFKTDVIDTSLITSDNLIISVPRFEVDVNNITDSSEPLKINFYVETDNDSLKAESYDIEIENTTIVLDSVSIKINGDINLKDAEYIELTAELIHPKITTIRSSKPIATQESYYAINNIQTSNTIEGETATITYDIKNLGSKRSIQTVELLINGSKVRSESVELNENEVYSSTYNYNINIGEQSSLEVNVSTQNESNSISSGIDNLFVKTSSTVYDSNWDTIVNNEYGSNYRVADWTELEKAFQTYTSNQWSEITDDIWGGSGSYFVYNNGSQFKTSDRAYFATYHGGSVPDYYAQHDDINNDEISLGSWDNDKRILAINEGSSTF